MEIMGDETTVVGPPGGEATQFSSMFGASGPADLAMARKMDASGANL
jgi:hypothetical protein